MNKDLLKKIGIALGVVLLFLVLSYGFVPQVLEGKIVNQSDISGYIGMSHEMTEWNRAHPEDPARWTNSMFSGMPTTAISNVNKGDWTQPVYDFLLTGKRPATYLFLALLGAFLLMLSLGVNWVIALGGAVAVAFCAYNFQIIQVGHNTKMQAIAFLPWVLAALIFTYRSALEGRNLSKTLLGAALFGLTVSFQVKANHQQITYYLALLIVLYVLMQLVWVLWRSRDRFSAFLTASLLLIALGGVGIATNVNKLLPLYKYTAYTMRGGSELSGEPEETNSEGLALDYATAWSYGWEELPNLMIPNFNGGSSSGAVNPDRSETVKVLRQAGQRNPREAAKSLPMYWGPQPFTAGPMYMGAITVFLFVLGLCLYRGREKWWLLTATLLAVLMAVGSHFMAFTKLCFDVLPLYNKFRTVSMALVMLQVTLPMLGFLALDRMVRGEYAQGAFRRGSLIALCLTAGFCLLCYLFPGVAGTFHSQADADYPEVLSEAFAADRRTLLRQDARMSFLLIAVTFALLVWACSGGGDRRRRLLAGAGVSALVLINMFAVGKRYLNADDFVTPRDFRAQFAARAADRAIWEDPDPHYRVMDMSVNVFNSALPSYWHKNIGGYSPAKLQRYQDLIDKYLIAEYNDIRSALRGVSTVQELEQCLPDIPVLNMLNCKYLILGGDYAPVRNSRASGNAWFVDSAVPAATPDEELAAIGELADLTRTAVIGEDFAAERRAAEAAFARAADSAADTIGLTRYTPNELRYHYRTAADRVAVFSEVYYPEGWHAVIDGREEIPLFRADWILRAAVLPEGEHDLVLRFAPPSYRTGERISRWSSILLILLSLFAIGGMAFGGKRTLGRKTEQ